MHIELTPNKSILVIPFESLVLERYNLVLYRFRTQIYK